MPRVLRLLITSELLHKGEAATEKQLREQAATSPPTESSLEALELLAAAGKTDALTQLRGLLTQTPPVELRALAVLSLARLGETGLLDELRKLLDTDAYRQRAAAALGSLGPSAKPTEEKLLALMSSPDVVLQKTAAASLIAIAQKESHVRGD